MPGPITFASPNYVSAQPSTDDLSALCTASHDNVMGTSETDYGPHHEPFQYYASTATRSTGRRRRSR